MAVGSTHQARAQSRRSAHPSREAGNALVVALLVLMVLTSAGVAYVAVTKSERQISGNSVLATEALYTAEAGITEGLHRMSFANDTANYIGPIALPSAGWGRYVVLAAGASSQDPGRAALASDGLDNNGNVLVDEPGERYPEVLSKQTGAGLLRYPYVRIEYKTKGGQLVRFGDADQNAMTPPIENLTSGTPMLRITAAGRKGTANKVLEAEAVQFPLLSVESAMWIGGYMSFNGNAFLIDGADHQATAPYDTIAGAPKVMGILTEGPPTDADLAENQKDNVTGDGGDYSVAQSMFNYDFNAIWSNLSSIAEYTFSGDQTWGSSTPAYGTLANPAVTVVKGNLGIKGTWTGSGILMVDGNLEMQGGSQFMGIVICTGDAALAGGGPADVAHVIGGIITGGSLINNSSTGGAARIYYSSQAVNNALTVNRYTLAWWRER